MKTRNDVMRCVGILRKLKLVAARLGLATGVLVSGPASAVLTTCNVEEAAVPDGRGVDSISAVNTANATGHLFTAVAGRSYTVEVYATASVEISQFRNAALVTINANACNGANMAGLNVTSDQEPIGGTGSPDQYKASFISTGGPTEIMVTGNPATVSMTNPLNSFNYGVRVTETTLYQPLWGTTGGFHTFWNIQNTTTLPCTAVLTLKSSAGAPVSTSGNKVILAGGSLELDTIGLATPLNQVGNATIAHNCAPGALSVDTFLENVTTSAVLPAKIQTRGASR